MGHKSLGVLLLLGLLTACTGTSESELPSRVVVMDQIEQAVPGDASKPGRVAFKSLQVSEGRPVLQSFERPGTATGMESPSDGRKILAGFTDRVEVYVPQDDQNNSRPPLTLDRSTVLPDGTFTVKAGNGPTDHPCTGTLTLDRPQLNANATSWLVLSTCNREQSPNNQRLWRVNFSTGGVELLFDNSRENDVIVDYAAGLNNVLFVQQRPGTSDFFINSVSYGANRERQIDIVRPIAGVSSVDVEVWREGLYFADGNRIGTIKTIDPLKEENFLAYPASSLIRQQDQLLAVSSGSACLVAAGLTCDRPQQGQLNVYGVRDAVFDLSGYAWLLSSSTLYRVDIQSAQKEATVESSSTFSLQDARGLAWWVIQ